MPYKMQGKTSSGEIIDVPLAADYDGQGREIAATYAVAADIEPKLATIEEIIKYRLPLGVATWAQIDAIGKLGIAHQVWKVGDTKKIPLTTGEDIVVEIWGFNHDKLTAGGRAPISFGLKEALATAYRMNAQNTNVGGWESCEMRTVTLETIYNYLPDEVKAVIKPVDKLTSEGDTSDSIVTTSDKLWLPSHDEVFGTNLGQTNDYMRSFPGEGHQYEYFAEAEFPAIRNGGEIKALNSMSKGTFYNAGKDYTYFYSRFDEEIELSESDDDGDYIYNYRGIKGRGIDATSSIYWWLRSPGFDSSNNFCNVNYDGNSIDDYASYSRGVVFGFCV